MTLSKPVRRLLFKLRHPFRYCLKHQQIKVYYGDFRECAQCERERKERRDQAEARFEECVNSLRDGGSNA